VRLKGDRREHCSHHRKSRLHRSRSSARCGPVHHRLHSHPGGKTMNAKKSVLKLANKRLRDLLRQGAL
jgi:hypothetical protein